MLLRDQIYVGLLILCLTGCAPAPTTSPSKINPGLAWGKETTLLINRRLNQPDETLKSDLISIADPTLADLKSQIATLEWTSPDSFPEVTLVRGNDPNRQGIVVLRSSHAGSLGAIWYSNGQPPFVRNGPKFTDPKLAGELLEQFFTADPALSHLVKWEDQALDLKK